MNYEDLFATRDQGLQLQEIDPAWIPVFAYIRLINEKATGGDYSNPVYEYDIEMRTNRNSSAIYVIAPTMQETKARLPKSLNDANGKLIGTIYMFLDKIYYDVAGCPIFSFTAQGTADLLLWVHKNHPESLTHGK